MARRTCARAGGKKVVGEGKEGRKEGRAGIGGCIYAAYISIGLLGHGLIGG